MANPLKWLEQLDALQSVDAIKGYLDSAVEKAGGEGSWGGAIAKGILSPAYAPVHAVSGLGGLIGGAAGAVGGALSEAGQDGAIDTLKAGFEGTKAGAETGAKAARENITALDLASLGAGSLASGASKAAKGAAAIGDLGKAASLAKGAKAAELADLGLSGVDAAVGGSQIVSGIQEKDPLKAIMGGARVAGNAYGGVKSLRSASEVSGFGKEAKILDQILKDEGSLPKSKSVATAETPGTMEDIPSWISRMSPEWGKKWEPVRGLEKSGDKIRTLAQPQTRSGKYYTMEAADIIGKMDVERVTRDPKRLEAYSDMTDYVHQLEAAAQEELPRLIEERTGTLDPWSETDALQITQGSGRHRGWIFGDGLPLGYTWAQGSRIAQWPHSAKNNAYFLNAKGIAQRVTQNLESLLDPNLMGEEHLNIALRLEPGPVADYVARVRSGEIPRSMDVEDDLKALMFTDTLEYDTLHEAFSHAPFNSGHENPVNYAYVVHDPRDPKALAYYNARRRIGLQEATAGTDFDPAQNVILSALEDPEQLKAFKAIRESELHKKRMRDWYRASLGASVEGTLEPNRPTLRQGRTVGTTEHAAAKAEFAPQEPREAYGEAIGTPLRADEPGGSGAKGGSDDATRMAMTAEETDAIDAKNALIKREVARKTGLGAKFGNQEVRTQPTPAAAGTPGAPGGGGRGPGGHGTPLPVEDPMGEHLRPLAERIKMAFAEQNKLNTINEMKNRTFRHEKMNIAEGIIAKFKRGEINGDQMLADIKKAYEGDHGLITESLGMRLAPGEYDAVLRIIMDETAKNTMERTGWANAWRKLVDGERLQPHEVEGLKQALSTTTAESREQAGFWAKLARGAENIIGGSRALMSSMDLSAAGRQALYASVVNPKETARAFKDQIAALRMTRPEFEAYMKRLTDPTFNPYAELSEAAGLHITAPHDLGERVEEAFINPTWAEKVPGVRRTEQAYIAYLNKMRVELFNKGANLLDESGVPPLTNEGEISQAYRDLAYMVNTLTGRGEMSLFHISPNSPMGRKLALKTELKPGEKTMNQMHRGLTTVFFAPRFTASRAAILRDSTLAMLGGGNLDPAVYKMYMKNVWGTYAAISAVAGMAVATGIGTFQADPRKTDFGNLKVGNVRYDLFGGVKQWAKLFATLESDKYWSKTYGWTEYGGRAGAKSKTGEVGKFLQSKLSPPAGFLLEALTGEDYLGRKSNALRAAYGHSFPMIFQTIQEVVESGEADQLAIAAPAAALGVGVNAYKPQRGGSWRK